MGAMDLRRPDQRWWSADEGKKHEAVWDVATRILRAQDYRRMNNLLHASLYGNVQQFGFSPQSYGRPVAGEQARLSLNVVKNMTAAVVSKIAAKNKVKPTFLTSGGDYSLRRKARQLEKFVGGVFYDLKLYRKQRSIFRNAAIFGTGTLKVYVNPRTNRICADPVPCWELLIDDAEAIYGEPRSIGHVKYYDRLVAKALFPKAEKLDNAPETIEDAAANPNPSRPDPVSDLIPIVEYYHLPSVDVDPDDPKAEHDGRRVIVSGNEDLVDEPWTRPTFPFPSMRWSEDPCGWFGTGLAYELAGIQAEIDDLLEEIQRAHRLIKGHWLVDHSSKVILSHLNDDLAAIVRYAGVKPEYNAPVAVAPDVYSHLWNLYAKAYEIAGISQLDATSQKPAGLNSGVALRAYDDIKTERFLEVGMALEDWTMDTTENIVECARDVAKGGGYVVKAKDKNKIEKIDFKDVDLRRDEYLLQVFPTSMLPSTPSGRIAFAQDMINSKMMSPEDGFELIDFPDTEQYIERRNAPRQLLERNFESIIEEGRWVAPQPSDDHDLALRLVPQAIAKARNDGVEEPKLKLLRKYWTLTQRLQRLANPPPPPPGPPPMPPPGAPPGMPPGMPPGPPPPMPAEAAA